MGVKNSRVLLEVSWCKARLDHVVENVDARLETLASQERTDPNSEWKDSLLTDLHELNELLFKAELVSEKITPRR